MRPGIHKLRYLLATRSELFMRVALLAALVGVLGAGFTFTNPPTTVDAMSSDQQPITMRLHSQATVEKASSIYSKGEVLTDMPVYMRSYTPTVTLSLVTTPPSGRQTEIDQQLSLVYEARTDSGEVFWQQREVLQQTKAPTNGEPVVSNASLNISATNQKLTQLESEIGDAGHVGAYILVESQYVTANSTGSMNRKEPIQIRDDSYEIPLSTEENMVGTTASASNIDPSKSIGVPFLPFGTLILPHTTLLFALLGLCGASGFATTVVYADRFDPEDEQRALHKARYAEWISTGSLPATFEAQTTHMSTLEDLVDMAIDTDSRIVHDISQEKYAVIGAEMVYLYVESADQEFLWT